MSSIPTPPPTQQTLMFDSIPLLTPDEIYELADQALIAAVHEDRRIERKPAGFQPRPVGDYVCMWANTTPAGGILALGVDNNGVSMGCSQLAQDRLNDLERAPSIYCPDASVEMKRVPIVRPDGAADFILVFRVLYRSDKVVETSAGEAYHRLGESKHKLTAHEIRELQNDKGQVAFEREPSRVPYPDGFDSDLVAQFTSSVREQKVWDEYHATEDILRLRHLCVGNIGCQPNNACTLLLAGDPMAEFPGCRIRFLRFDGETEGTGEKFNAVKDIFIEGPVPRQIAEVEKVLDGQLREFARLGPDGKFYTAPEYPKLAWYEAVVNACVHRSYSLRNMNIFIKMFDDRLEIESPGAFPPLVNPQNIYDVHHPRNPILMDAMYYLRFVKCAHEGTRRIRDTMTAIGLPAPEFKERTGGPAPLVTVVLRNNIRQRKVWIDSEATALIGETIYASLTQDEKRAINFVAEHGTVTVTQLQKVTNRTWDTAKKVLKRLETRGLLRHVKNKRLDRDPKAHYVLRDRS